MWTETTRRKYERDGRRYASDLTDAEWGLIEPHMPAAKPLGRPREIELRAVLDAILYIARTGCQWRMLPKDFPPFTTVQGYFYDWRDDGLFEKINFALLLQAREAAGREASPSAGVIDSQSAKTTERGGPRGGACPRARQSRDPGDAAKKIKGRKRHIVTDTCGLLAPRRCPRSRWCRAGHRGRPPVVSLAAPSLRRQCLQRPQLARSSRQIRQVDHRDRQTRR